MDWYQGVVADYLQADRSIFVNAECLISLDRQHGKKGRYWYVDIAAVNFKDPAVYMCEVTLSKTVDALVRRMRAWSDCWCEFHAAVVRTCQVPSEWPVVPWAFIPRDHMAAFVKKMVGVVSEKTGPGSMPKPRLTFLENVAPWTYPTESRTELSTEAYCLEDV